MVFPVSKPRQLPPAIADAIAINPAYLPITSTTMVLLCDSAVVLNLSIDSVAVATAVSKPKSGICRS